MKPLFPHKLISIMGAVQNCSIPFLSRVVVLLAIALAKFWFAAKVSFLLFIVEALALAGMYYVIALFFVIVFKGLPKTIAHGVGHNFAFVLILCFESAELVSFWLQHRGLNFQFFYHLSDLNFETTKIYLAQAIAGVLAIPCLTFISSKVWGFDKNPYCRGFALACFLLLPWNPMVAAAKMSYAFFWPTVTTLEKALVELEDKGIETKALRRVEMRPVAFSNSKAKNLILVYLESIEQKYIHETDFPGLTPNIHTLIASGALHFSNLSQMDYTGWTIGGMFSSQCGLPLVVSKQSFGNDVMHTRASTNFLCLGDILHDAGYYQAYFQGADLTLAGVKEFYSTHGYNELVEVRDVEYKSQWGVHDAAVFDAGLKKAAALAAKHEPFNLTLATMDTHHPGMPASDCPSPAGVYSEDLILKAVHCTDLKLKQFIDALSQIPFSRDTLIFVLSDHLSMTKFVGVPDRKLLAFAIGKDIPKRTISKPGNYFDIAPTVLELLGVDHKYVFPLGRSLLQSDVIGFDLKNENFRTALYALISFRKNTSAVEVVLDPPSVQVGDKKLSLTFGNNYYYGEWPSGFSTVLEVDSSGNIASIETVETKSVSAQSRSIFNNYRVVFSVPQNHEAGERGLSVEVWEPKQLTPRCSVFVPKTRIRFDSLEKESVCTTARNIQAAVADSS